MRKGHQWLERKQQSELYSWKQWRSAKGTLCNSYTKKNGTVPPKKWEKNERKNYVTVPTTQLWQWINSDPRGSYKMECLLGNNRKKLYRHFVTLTQSRMRRCLLKIHLEAMEIPLHETCVTFKQKNYRNII